MKIRGKKLTLRDRFLLHDHIIGLVIGGIVTALLYEPGDYITWTIISAWLWGGLATIGIIITNPVYDRLNKKRARRVTSTNGQEKAVTERASSPSFYTIRRDYTI